MAASDWEELAGLARKIEREEAYHRLHADMWIDRLAGGEERPRLRRVARGALALRAGRARRRRCATGSASGWPRGSRGSTWPASRGPSTHAATHTGELAPLWDEMTMVRRSIPGAQW